ncbi:107aa long hypothetical protein [Pyrococcus horikoshii OT3]|uniref:Uncharacterized protein n=1 Tax=Pyrococcus horikoshii (strain ATCC 700860 / DSM 12428 / JCM 9974 / NBRC 100139 / OT-3) TaxID=70601 RepID=O57748_PYRHO|nr:107aa long hypothetical protein [Pyrococcus horikoshii OT3]
MRDESNSPGITFGVTPVSNINNIGVRGALYTPARTPTIPGTTNFFPKMLPIIAPIAKLGQKRPPGASLAAENNVWIDFKIRRRIKISKLTMLSFIKDQSNSLPPPRT